MERLTQFPLWEIQKPVKSALRPRWAWNEPPWSCGNIVASFHCSPSPGTVPRDWRELPAPIFSLGRERQDGTIGPMFWLLGAEASLRDWLLSHLSWTSDRTHNALDAWGPLKTGKSCSRGPCTRDTGRCSPADSPSGEREESSLWHIKLTATTLAHPASEHLSVWSQHWQDWKERPTAAQDRGDFRPCPTFSHE